ncbi:MAG: hypothetical protein AAGB01_04060 [Cyanobacteria bacterium P01_F01_bin.42]
MEEFWATATINNSFDLRVSIYSIYGNDQGATPSKVTDAPSIYVGFSAGVLRAAAAAHIARQRGQTVKGLIALDGWGVPLCDDAVPVYRFSHDLFTHATSPLLGGAGIFFADPPVPHLHLWGQAPQTRGWYLQAGVEAIEISEIEALARTIELLLMNGEHSA